MERVERRGSVARALSRIRTAMKRRRPAPVQTIRNDQPFNGTSDSQTSQAHSSTSEFHFERSTTRLDHSPAPTSDLVASIPKEECSDQRLEPDPDEYTDNDEPLLPIASARPGISDSKARELYSRYGLLYHEREHTYEEGPPRKLRRVERPIRIRVHWTCHACKTQFGLEKTCVECGHQRCAQCSRQPPRRVQDVLETGRYMMEQSEQSQQELMSCEEGSREPSANSTPNDSPIHSAIPSPSPSLDMDPSVEVDVEVEHSSFPFPMYARPNAAIRLFGSDYLEEHPQMSKLDKCSMGLSRLRKFSIGEVPMVSSVQRVYRKPRQRVRYTCEHCATLLVEGDRCRECDHNRFHRNPPKRTPRQYDADILHIAANRLSVHGGGFTPQEGLTA